MANDQHRIVARRSEIGLKRGSVASTLAVAGLIAGILSVCQPATAQTVLTNPTSSQTITQPSGTSLTITSGDQGNVNGGGTTLKADQLVVQMPWFVFGANNDQGTPVAISLIGGNITFSGANSSGQPTNGGQINLLAPGFFPSYAGDTLPGGPNFVGSNGSVGGLDVIAQHYTSSFNSQALDLAIANGYFGDINIDAGTFANQPGNVNLISGSGSNLNFFDSNNPGTYGSFFCGSTQNDWVGVQTPGTMTATQGCNPYDIFDVSNRETFGDGYMHWYGGPPSNPNVLPTAGWNVGISNPSAGILSFDSTTDGNAQGKVKMGTLTLTTSQGGAIFFQDGTTQSTAWNGTTLGGDYAESIDVQGDKTAYQPGDVIAIDSSSPGKFLKSAQPYSTLVAGVYSTKPGLVGRRTTFARTDKDSEIPMAMMGIVPTKVTTENGPLRPGDLLVTSSTPGYAMKATDPSRTMGAVIGKALAPLTSGTGIIEVLISLQ